MRVLVVTTVFVLTVFAAQLVRIQGLDAQAVAQEAQDQRVATQILPAGRGQILAADGTVLASSVIREVVVADLTAVCTYGTGRSTCDPATTPEAVRSAARDLAPLLGQSESSLVDQLTGDSRYRILSKEVTPLTWNRISDLGIPGIYRDRRETRSERVYPQGTTTAALVGYVTDDGTPGGGVELMMDEDLQGVPGTQTYEVGRDGTAIPAGHSTTHPRGRRRGRAAHRQPGAPVVRPERAGPADQGDRGQVRLRRHPGRQAPATCSAWRPTRPSTRTPTSARPASTSTTRPSPTSSSRARPRRS